MSDLHHLTALAQAALIRRGEVSVEELTRHYLARIERHDRALGAFVELRPDLAVTDARALDRERRRAPDAERSRLFGVPTGIKDLQLTRGFYARMGSRAFRWLWSPLDDVTSAAVRKAGLVIVGKLACSELAIMPVVETDLHPPTRNPWDPARSAGGSSGGSGAAVAAGLLPLAPASDGAGSVRIPAAFCGLVGHKSSRGALPNPHAPFDPIGIAVVGPHARDVDDAAALMDVLAGLDGRAAGFLERARVPPRPMRVAFTTRSPLGPVDPIVLAAVERVASALTALGHRVEPGPDLVGDVDEFLPMFKFLVRKTFIPSAALLQPVTRWLRDEGAWVTLAQACAMRDLFTRRTDAWFGAADLWLMPTVASLPPAVGAWRNLDGRAAMYAAAPLGAFTAPFNASGQPGTSVPVWVDGCALPVGVQLVGRVGDDARLLATARVVMEALGEPHGRLSPMA